MKIFQTISEKIREIKKNHAQKKEKKITPKNFWREKKNAVEIEISASTIFKIGLIAILFFVGAQIFLKLQTILTTTGIVFFLSIGLSPILDAIEEKFFFPRPAAILFLYLVFFGALAILFVQIVPIIAEQLQDIAYDLSEFVKNDWKNLPLLSNFKIDAAEMQNFLTKNLSAISENLQSITGSTFKILAGIFSGVFNFIFALVLLFFILMERESIGSFFLSLFPKKDTNYILEKTKIVQKKMSEWFRGQIILMISMGIFMYAGMKIFEFAFDMKYAATIALLAAFAELFPYIGPILTGALAILIAVNVSWIAVIAILIWMAIAQFLEGNFLVPIVMEKAVGMSSATVMIALAIGGTLGNAIGGVPLAILGMILAIPVGASIAIFVDEYAHRES